MTNRKTTVKAEAKYTIEDMQKHASVASTADGLKLEGPNFKLTCLTACPDMLLFACEELTKANERVKELEKESLAFRSILNGDMKPEDYHKLSSSKFALEQKIEVLKLALDDERFELDGRPLDFGIRVESLELMLRDFEIGLNSMQIRKEQDNG
ncbi:hypothetical protein EP12_06800 [Alteromonas australica]|nr:hypothetical protein EP12_06800 [Alteromonas australica]